MIKPYLITFKPAGRFYFGSVKSFAEGFFVESESFPAATTILGCLRHTILKQNRMLDLEQRLPAQNSNYKAFTGSSKADDLYELSPDLGIIKNISPVFLVYQPEGYLVPQDFMFHVPSDIYLINKNIPGKEEDSLKMLERMVFSLPKTGIKTYASGEEHDTLPILKKEKEYSADCFGGKDFWTKYLKGLKPEYQDVHENEKIFIACSQPGISRTERITNKGDFYFKKDHKLTNSYKFGVIVHLELSDLNPELDNDDVMMGGERSLFRMNIKLIDNDLKSVVTDHPILGLMIESKELEDTIIDSEIFVLLSPSLIKNGKSHIGLGMVNNLFGQRTYNKMKSGKSNTYNMIPSGSILLKQQNTNNEKTLHKIIGYNYAIKAKRPQ